MEVLQLPLRIYIKNKKRLLGARAAPAEQVASEESPWRQAAPISNISLTNITLLRDYFLGHLVLI